MELESLGVIRNAADWQHVYNHSADWRQFPYHCPSPFPVLVYRLSLPATDPEDHRGPQQYLVISKKEIRALLDSD